MIEQPTSRIIEGEENYRKFWKEFTKNKSISDLRKESPDFIRSNGSIEKENDLRAVFLGIKPSAIVYNEFKRINFEKYGLKKIGLFIYDEELANLVIKENKDIFDNVENAEDFFKELKRRDERLALMEKLHEKFKVKMDDGSLKKSVLEDIKKETRIGIMLGYPRLASEKFGKNINSFVPKEAEKVRFAVGGIAWMSYPNIDQTEDKKFKGILEKSFKIANNL